MQQDGCTSLQKGADSCPEIQIAFRGEAEGDPKAPGRLCDFWITEGVWANRKPVLIKVVQKSRKWRKGIGRTCSAVFFCNALF